MPPRCKAGALDTLGRPADASLLKRRGGTPVPLAMLALAIILLASACDTPQPAGDAIPPAGPEALEGDY